MCARLCKAILATIAQYYNFRTIHIGLWVVGWPVLNADYTYCNKYGSIYINILECSMWGCNARYASFSGADSAFGVFGVHVHHVGAATTVLTAIATA